MCETCGCGDGEWTVTRQSGSHSHYHVHRDGTAHAHAHSDAHEHSTVVRDIGGRVLAANDAIAATNREWLAARDITAINLMSAPGAGKTSLLERTVREFASNVRVVVIEGDQATDNDARRIRAAGVACVQINTGKGCHLDATMVARALAEANPPRGALLLIENVGNLVCPSLFDLGESRRIALLSVTEGDDKPLKYPHMFMSADLLLINKIDLLHYVDFDIDQAVAAANSINSGISVLQLSARTGAGLNGWYAWLRGAMHASIAATTA